MKYFKVLSLILFGGLLFFSCRKDKDGPSWDTQILTPIISTELKIKDLVDTSSFLSSDAGNLITIEYTDEFYKLENPLDSFVDLSVESFSSIFTLDSLALDNVSVDQSIVLDSFKTFEVEILPGIVITNTLDDSTEITQAFLDNVNVGALPPFNTSQDISGLLQEAILSQADLMVNIANRTEFELINLKYEIMNSVDGFVIDSVTIPIIPAGDTYLRNIDIAQQIGDNPVRGELDISVSGAQIKVPNGEPSSRFIYSHGIDFSASISNIKVKSATAQFSEQEVINSRAPVDVIASSSEKITLARIKRGVVNLKAFSTLPTDLTIRYAIPNLSQGGSTFSLVDVISNDFSTSVNRKDTNFLFNDFVFDLTLPFTLPPRKYNSFLRESQGTIASTDGPQFISIEDTLGIDVALTEIIPSYVRGFVGKEEYFLKDTIDFQLIEGLEGNLDFTSVELSLCVENELGLTPQLIINNLQSINSETGQTATYSGNMGPFTVSSANEVGLDFSSVSSEIVLTDAENLLSILPDKIVYDIQIAINAGEDPDNPKFDDFLHSGASLIAGIKVGVPFELGPDARFSLMDTISFDQQDQIEIPDEFQDGTISILAENGFPLDADIKLFFINDLGEIIDSLTSPQVIQAARINPITQEIEKRTESKIDFANISNARLTQMVDSPHVLFTATLATGGATDVRVLDTYSMKIQLVGDFGYTLKSNF